MKKCQLKKQFNCVTHFTLLLWLVEVVPSRIVPSELTPLKLINSEIFAFGSCTFRSCNVGSCTFEKVLSKFKNCTLKLYTFEIDTFGTCTLRCHPFGSCTFESYTSEGTTYEGVTFDDKTSNSCYYYDDDGRVLFYSMIFMICHTTQCLKLVKISH